MKKFCIQLFLFAFLCFLPLQAREPSLVKTFFVENFEEGIPKEFHYGKFLSLYNWPKITDDNKYALGIFPRNGKRVNILYRFPKKFRSSKDMILAFTYSTNKRIKLVIRIFTSKDRFIHVTNLKKGKKRKMVLKLADMIHEERRDNIGAIDGTIDEMNIKIDRPKNNLKFILDDLTLCESKY